MALKVHGSPISSATQRALAAVMEKQLEFELVPVDMASGAHKKEPFISLNPFGQVPALQDGDLTLFESRAIASYIGEAYASQGTPLVSQDPKENAIISVWCEVEAQKFDPAGSKLAWEIVYKPMFGMTTDPAAVEEHEAKISPVLDVYEARLTESKYLGGNNFSLADLYHLPSLQFLVGTPTYKKVFEPRPKVDAWVKDILARPAWQSVIEMQKN
ncbi:glutathione S-transferase APIC-like [Impatiens glandulifera]|uniref:glutathione S-transferase APIC-like n=1 Tax=Impatiens glandulifera TaxID=253017 RepID=UPI001FB0B0A0|nr:glutathione S-transferase APIC-like [Impatiens glandulifera]